MKKEKKKCHFCGSSASLNLETDCYEHQEDRDTVRNPRRDSYILIEFSDGSGLWKCHDDNGCLTRMAKR